jgi:hypothetical protein|tara:strand:+ start:27663 stop:28604 length:942 start_codon:yes stop_codon:yes gene_type:complete
MASELDVTSNFTGDHAGRYIAAALKGAVSLEFVDLMENIKYKRNITQVTGGKHGAETGHLVTDRTCDWKSEGKLVLTDKVLEPKRLQVNYEICKKDLIKDWQALQMKSGQWNTNMGADFSAFLLSHVAGIIAETTEVNMWTGAAATGGQFEGFTTAGTGIFVTDAVTTAPAPTGGAYAAATIIDDLAALLAAVPAAVYAKASEDLYMYMGVKAYRIYINAISAAGYINAYSMNNDYQPFFEGVKIAVCAGMPDDQAVVAQKSNLFFGTDLLSDETEIRVLDMANIDGSDNIRIVAKYSAGVQSGYAKDITWQK